MQRLNEPKLPQYRSAKSILKTLEKMTYQKLGDTSELDLMADEVESKTGSEQIDKS